ncbi:cytochrome d ubiquinol oxidase subunit II [bacterium BFN5]|nr:cytochrome d ubiquinol oxidase subunit II [bacterium BFN5]QJW46484.1 cytochrome d ubiquinol oxidase subunit II [bacterium BFN5]
MGDQILCFSLFGILLLGYLILEGIDYGVGMMMPFAAKTDLARQVLLNTIAPVWEGHEVWLIAAGAVLFAGFPDIYATLFSGMYLLLFMILAALILRGLAIELRNMDAHKHWHIFCDWSICAGGVIPAFSWGVILGGLLHGLPIDSSKEYSGSILAAINVYTVTTGILFTLIFLVQGMNFLILRVEQNLTRSIIDTAARYYSYTIGVHLIFIVFTYVFTQAGEHFVAVLALISSAVSLLLGRRLFLQQKYWLSMAASTFAMMGISGAIFAAMFPKVIVSSVYAGYSLDIYNSSASAPTLKVINKAMLIAIPLLITGQLWKANLFWNRLSMAALAFEQGKGELRMNLRKTLNLLSIAQALADTMDKVSQSYRGRDGNVLKQLTTKTRGLLCAPSHNKKAKGKRGKKALASERRNH